MRIICGCSRRSVLPMSATTSFSHDVLWLLKLLSQNIRSVGPSVMACSRVVSMMIPKI
jgi:hypothetical protein